MAHPSDNSGLLNVGDEIRDYEYERGLNVNAGKLAEATQRASELTVSLAAELAKNTKLTNDLAAADKKYADHMATHAPVETIAQQLVAVRVFPQYGDKNYGDHAKVLSTLGELGVKRISGLLTPNMAPEVIEFYQRANRDHGIKVWFTVGRPRVELDAAAWADIAAMLSGPLAGIVELCSGWNEPNHIRGKGHAPAGWEKTTAAHQGKLWAVCNPLGIQVGTPQLWSGTLSTHDTDLKVLAPLLAGKFDVTAWHLYPRGEVGTSLVDRFDTAYKTALGTHPVVCTEAGYFTATVNDTGGEAVTEAEQAALWPAHLGLYIDRGYRVSIFELLDDPAGGREGTLGIVHADWTPKPAFTAIKALLA